MSNYPAPPRWSVIALRVTAGLTAVLALVLPFLAGGFLQGYYPLLNLHKISAMVLATTALLTAVAGVLVWRLGNAPSKVAIQYGVLTVLAVAQITLGFSRLLLLHVPLGVGIFVMSEKFAVDAFAVKAGAAEAEPEPEPEAVAAE